MEALALPKRRLKVSTPGFGYDFAIGSMAD